MQPAVTHVHACATSLTCSLSLAIVGVLSPVRLVLYCACSSDAGKLAHHAVIVEIVAAIAAAATIEGVVPGSLAVTPCAGSLLRSF